MTNTVSWSHDQTYLIGDPEYGWYLCKVTFLEGSDELTGDDRQEVLEWLAKRLAVKIETRRACNEIEERK